jgi:hypothetical protein
MLLVFVARQERNFMILSSRKKNHQFEEPGLKSNSLIRSLKAPLYFVEVIYFRKKVKLPANRNILILSPMLYAT